ncbi:MAG: biotin--[acetyl-CoA-carboxylase] ligase [Rhodospirillum sp.]|nr:biotin--[acetyl-CoA-carboxylase] ligase [Rhodospirillum sp.]MCF8489025.1 biotin--[acetyl-CoA-carboxylase] ligase [Rhodospirillum sp.]MCF8503180.1 biotin--[acetyl-CoA-carboxylase] ligase [Rhodospirillum sp.]
MDANAISLPQGWALDIHPRLSSTNATAKDHVLAETAREGLIVWAGEQTGGRGRRGRVWHSPKGNLYHSYLFRSGAAPAVNAQLSFVGAVALAEAIESLCAFADPRCKWPNDIVCHGGKVSGMLLEQVETPKGWGKGDPKGEAAWLVLGIGVNIATAPITGALFPALALADLGCGITVESLLEAIAGSLNKWIGKWRTDGFAPIRDAWLGRALGVGKPIVVRLSDTVTLPGVFEGLDGDGHLVLVEQGGGRRLISAGDVFFPGLEGTDLLS